METHRHLDIHEHDVYGQRFRSFSILQPTITTVDDTTVRDLFLPATALLQDRKRFETLVRDGYRAFRSL